MTQKIRECRKLKNVACSGSAGSRNVILHGDNRERFHGDCIVKSYLQTLISNEVQSRIILNCQIPFHKLSGLLTQKFGGYALHDKLRIVGITVKGERKWLIVHLKVTGAYHGTVVVRFIPDYIPAKRRFRLNNLDIGIEEEHLLAKGANWILKRFYADTLHASVERILRDEVPALLEAMISEYAHISLGHDIAANLDIESLDISEIRSMDNALHCQIRIQTTVTIQ